MALNARRSLELLVDIGELGEVLSKAGHRISLDSGRVIWRSGFRQAIDYRNGSVGHRGLEKTIPLSLENVKKTKSVEHMIVPLLQTRRISISE